MRAAVVGVTGYSGTELFRILSNHPKIEEINLYAREKEGVSKRCLNKEVSAFRNIEDELLPYDAKEIMERNDVVFFAVPAGVTGKLAAPFIQNDFPVIDLSGDFRLKDPKDMKNGIKNRLRLKKNLKHPATDWLISISLIRAILQIQGVMRRRRSWASPRSCLSI